MPRKPTVKKRPATNHQSPTTIWQWLFIPEKPFSFGKWALRALCGTVATFVAMAFILALALGIMYGVGILSLLPTAFSTIGIAIKAKPVVFAFITLALFIINAFAFMPRAELSRRGFMATLLSGLFWLIVAVIGIELINPNIPVLPIVFVGAIFLFTIMMIAGMFRYMAHIGVSKWQQILSFPFGTSFYTYAGLFLDQPNDVNIGAKSKWFSGLIGFLNNTRAGLILMGIIMVGGFIFAPEPWSILLGIVFVTAWAARGAKWIFGNISAFAWLSVAINIAMIILALAALELYPEIISTIGDTAGAM